MGHNTKTQIDLFIVCPLQCPSHPKESCGVLVVKECRPIILMEKTGLKRLTKLCSGGIQCMGKLFEKFITLFE